MFDTTDTARQKLKLTVSTRLLDYSTAQCNTIQYNRIKCSTAYHSTVHPSTIHHNSPQYIAALDSTEFKEQSRTDYFVTVHEPVQLQAPALHTAMS